MTAHRSAAALLVLVALLPRLLVVLITIDRSPEVFEYEGLANNLLAGRGYTDSHLGTTYWSSHSGFPYVFLTAGVYAASDHSSRAMLLVQCLLSGVLVLVVHALGRRVGGAGVGVLAGVLVALHPGLVYYDTHKLHPLGFDALLMVSTTLAFCRLITTPSVRGAVITGLLSGLALLQRGTFLLAAVMGVCALWWLVRNRWMVLKVTLAFALGASLVVGPWLIRNYLHHGTLVLMTYSGELLWRGNNPHATGSSLTKDKHSILETADPAFRAQLYGLDELGQMQLFLASARRYITDHPWTFVANVAKRFSYFAWFSPVTGLLYPAIFLRIYQVYYGAMLIAAIIGISSMRRWWRTEHQVTWLTMLFLGGTWCLVGLAQSIFYVEIRHRWGVEGLMLVFSAVGIFHLLRLQPRRAER